MGWYLGYISLHGIMPHYEPNKEAARENWHSFIVRPGIGEALVGGAVCIVDIVGERLYVVRPDYIRHIPAARMPNMRLITGRPIFESLRTKPFNEITRPIYHCLSRVTSGSDEVVHEGHEGKMPQHPSETTRE